MEKGGLSAPVPAALVLAWAFDCPGWTSTCGGDWWKDHVFSTASRANSVSEMLKNELRKLQKNGFRLVKPQGQVKSIFGLPNKTKKTSDTILNRIENDSQEMKQDKLESFSLASAKLDISTQRGCVLSRSRLYCDENVKILENVKRKNNPRSTGENMLTKPEVERVMNPGKPSAITFAVSYLSVYFFRYRPGKVHKLNRYPDKNLAFY